MTGALVFRLVLLALVFVAWGWLLLRTITQAGGHRDGLGAGLGQWLRDPEAKRDRSTLFFLTFVLAAMLAMLVLLPAG